MSITSDFFISAQHAMWAGDYGRCVLLLTAALAPDRIHADREKLRREESPSADSRRDSPRLRASDELGEYSDPVTLIIWRAATLLELLEKAELPRPPAEFIVQTRHLRGVFHQVSARRFELRAFLLEWSWQGELLRRTRILAEAYQKANARRSGSTRRADAPVAPTELFDNPSSTWTIVESQMLLEATTSDFGLVVVTGTWIDRAEPSSADPIRSAFRRVLEAIEQNDIERA